MSTHDPYYQNYKKYEQVLKIVNIMELDRRLYKFFKEYNMSRTN